MRQNTPTGDIIAPLVPRDMAVHPNGERPDNGWPGPMPLTRTLPKLNPTERPMRLLADGLRRHGIHPTSHRPTASGEAVMICLDLNDVERLACVLGTIGARR